MVSSIGSLRRRATSSSCASNRCKRIGKLPCQVECLRRLHSWARLVWAAPVPLRRICRTCRRRGRSVEPTWVLRSLLATVIQLARRCNKRSLHQGSMSLLMHLSMASKVVTICKLRNEKKGSQFRSLKFEFRPFEIMLLITDAHDGALFSFSRMRHNPGF